MCLPASRTTLFTAETLGWLISGSLLLAAGYAGHLLATSFVHPEMRLTTRSTLLVLCNLAALYLAVGGLAFLLSSLSDRRGRAIGVVFAILLASFLLNFLAQFQDWAKQISWLSMMEYYRPAIVIQTDEFPWSDIGVLLGLAAATWIAALAVFRRRSICTV
jgi:ABC-2 type transport system permease protein